MQTADIFAETSGSRQLRLFTLYTDFAASLHARKVAAEIVALAGDRTQSFQEMWKLEILTGGKSLRKMISDDAAHADVLIIAVGSLRPRPVELVEWLGSLADTRPASSGPGLLVGLLGDKENPLKELDWTVKQLIRCARQSNRSFAWRWMDSEAIDDNSGWLNESVELLLAGKLLPSLSALDLREK